MKNTKMWLVAVIICVIFIALARSEPSRETYEQKAKRIKLYEPLYYGPRRMEVN